MAITATGLGTKTAPEGVNLDPQAQFWSFLNNLSHGAKSAVLSGFTVSQTAPAGLSVQVGGATVDVNNGMQDSAVLSVNGRKVLLSSDAQPQAVTLATAPAAGSRIDAIVSYIDMTGADASKEQPGTPSYVKTVAIAGTAGTAPSPLTDEQVKAKLPAAAGGSFIRWADVAVGTGATQVVDTDIVVAPSATVGDIITTLRNTPQDGYLLMDGSSYTRDDYPRLWSLVKRNGAYGTISGATFTLRDMRGRTTFGKSQNGTFATLGSTGGSEKHAITVSEMPQHSHPHSGTSIAMVYTAGGSAGQFTQFGTVGVRGADAVGGNTGNAGGGQAMNLLNPYVVVNYAVMAY